ncbi:unnamed protein product [Vitrella brassicaformis CCMP3155]|uniref:Major facilitator superfamily (MFS) profile domain-containing protein n=2 Tax=Vitrella brassicaformis TaxID=1169539 RepID=A0A0G4FK27_VITBC|nr:unnamed protein product [Vitrella brassicaformis CCMP3155]|eukprot:CEM14139.1 unnamed protein product [Vitrella brassicaformis CCMP3155]
MDSFRDWTIVLGSWLVHFASLGTVYTFGVFFPYLLAGFGASKAVTSLVYSVSASCFMFFGFLNGALVRRYGHRRMARVGAVIVLGGLIASSFVSDLWQLFLTYGVISGFGFGLSYMSCITIIALHFDKHRATATGLAVSGSGIGTLALAPTFDALLASIGWRHTFRVQAAICTALIVAASFFFKRPHQSDPYQQPQDQPQQREKDLEAKQLPAADGDAAADDLKVVIDEKSGYFVIEKATSAGEGEVEETSATGSDDRPHTPLQPSEPPSAAPPAAAEEAPAPPAQDKSHPDEGRGKEVQSVVTAKRSSAAPERQKSLMRLLPALHFDWSLFCDSRFVVLFIGSFFCSFAYFVPFSHWVEWGIENGIASDRAALTVTAFGVASTVSRVFVGRVADSLGRVKVFWLGTLIMCLDLAFLAIADQLWRLIVFALVLGIGSGAFIALTPVITAQLFGSHRLPGGLGFIYCAIGTANAMGPPFAGWVADQISYPAAFGFAALVMAVGCAFIGVLWAWTACGVGESRERFMRALSCQGGLAGQRLSRPPSA